MSHLFAKLQSHDIGFFRELLGESFVLGSREECLPYGSDETEDLSFPPEVVLKPHSTHEVSAILR